MATSRFLDCRGCKNPDFHSMSHVQNNVGGYIIIYRFDFNSWLGKVFTYYLMASIEDGNDEQASRTI